MTCNYEYFVNEIQWQNKGRNKGKTGRGPASPDAAGREKRRRYIYFWRMKFEMKKRILALALAGTTAFSVFGAAMSANAAWVYWNGDESTHITSDDGDYYEEYRPAGNMYWSTQTTPTQIAELTNEFLIATPVANLPKNSNNQTYIPAGTTVYYNVY